MDSSTDAGDQTGLIRRGQATGVGLAALYSAAVAYITLLIAAHTLTPADNAIFLAYWALLFGTFGVISGLAQEAARSSFDRQRVAPRSSPRVVAAAVAFAAAACLLLGLSAPLWAGHILDAENSWLVVVVVLAGVAFSGQLSITGVLTGQQEWRGLILVMTSESMVRLVCVILAFLFADTLAGLALGSAVAAAAWLLLLWRHDVRSAFRVRGDKGWKAQFRNNAHACIASASSAALVVGFPVLVRLTSTPAEYLGAAGLLLAVTLTRAPLMVPLNAYQGVVLTYFMRHRHERLRPLLRVAGVVLLMTAVACGLAALVGPWLFDLLLGGRYSADPWLLAGLTAGAGLLALLTLTGACCLAVGTHAQYSAGWVVATVVAILLLMIPLGLGQRMVLSLCVAPITGVLIHAWAILKATTAQSAVVSVR